MDVTCGSLDRLVAAHVPSDSTRCLCGVHQVRGRICALCFEFVNWVVLPLLVCPPFHFFWAPWVPLIFFLFYFGSVEVGSIFESSSRMLPVVFAPKFLSRSFLFPSSYQPGFFSIFSASLSICIYPLSSRALVFLFPPS